MIQTAARCYEVEAPGRGALRPCELRQPNDGEVLITADYSGISPGTERLVGLGLVPESCAGAMACQGMRGSFALPVTYGYSLVGTTADRRRVFTMHPHQDRIVVASDRLVPIPDDVPSPRATLLPNLETALNAVWDGELREGEKVAVVGGGAVGLLLTFVLSRLHHGEIALVESDAARRDFAGGLPWLEHLAAPERVAAGSFAIAFNATGTAAGLQTAIDAVGFEGRVVELSWYGDKPITLHLGGSFHWQRKRITASQVGTVAPSHRAGGRAARTRAVLELLADARLDALLGEPVGFDDLPAFFAELYGGNVTAPCPIVCYKRSP